jgi:flavin-dependent dehydrogenase
MEKTDYDVIIVGAGPAGLSVASELSREARVLVVDKKPDPYGEKVEYEDVENEVIINKPSRTTKAWFVPQDSVQCNKDLWARYVHYDTNGVLPEERAEAYGGVRRFLAKTFSDKKQEKDNPYGWNLCWKTKLFKAYPYVDENLIFNHWMDEITKNGSKIHYEQSYMDHHITNNKVKISFLRKKMEGRKCQSDTEVVTHTCRLLLDASGVNSEIMAYYEITPKKFYWWSVYGCIAKHKKGTIGKKPSDKHRLIVGDYMLWQTFKDTNVNKDEAVRYGRPIFEYEIWDEETSFLLILYLRKEKISRDYMKAEFMNIIRNEASAADFHDVDIKKFKYGWYPSGGLTLKTARDRVGFIGDTGSWTTPCGWGMGFIMRNYKAYAESLLPLLKNDRVDRRSLVGLVQLKQYQKTQFLMNKLATYFLANGTAKQLDTFINMFTENPGTSLILWGKIFKPKGVNPEICERMFTLRIRPQEIINCIWEVKKVFTWYEIYKIVPRGGHWSVFKDLVRLALEIIPLAIQWLFNGFKWPVKKRDFEVFNTAKPKPREEWLENEYC